MKLLFLFLLLFCFQPVYAGIVGETKITGRVLKYDQTTVTLALYGNQKVTFPRKFIRKSFKKQKLRTGRFATVILSAEDVMNQIKEQTKGK